MQLQSVRCLAYRKERFMREYILRFEAILSLYQVMSEFHKCERYCLWLFLQDVKSPAIYPPWRANVPLQEAWVTFLGILQSWECRDFRYQTANGMFYILLQKNSFHPNPSPVSSHPPWICNNNSQASSQTSLVWLYGSFCTIPRDHTSNPPSPPWIQFEN